jgi:hypothetical protein
MFDPTELGARHHTGAIDCSGGGIGKPFGSVPRRTPLRPRRRFIGRPAARANGCDALSLVRETVAGLSQRADSVVLAAFERPFEWGLGQGRSRRRRHRGAAEAHLGWRYHSERSKWPMESIGGCIWTRRENLRYIR